MAFASRQSHANSQTRRDHDNSCCDCCTETRFKGARGEPGPRFSGTSGIHTVSDRLRWFTWDPWGLPSCTCGLLREHILHSAALLCLGGRLWKNRSCPLSNWRFFKHQPCRLWLQLCRPDPKPWVQVHRVPLMTVPHHVMITEFSTKQQKDLLLL